MKEVKAGCYAGPFDNYIQSLIGLVSKVGGDKINLSSLKNGTGSVNECTMKELCSVKYNDLELFCHM